MSSPNDHLPLNVPKGVAVCPICTGALVVDEIQDWHEVNGKVVIDLESSVSVTCTTEPDIDSDEWEDWQRGHWSTPYMDWMPVQRRVTEWLMYNVPTSCNQPERKES